MTPFPKFRIEHFPELDSTSTYLRTKAVQGIPEGLVVRTDFQTAGRGQFDRKWESPAGKNLTFSILLRPPISPAQAPLVTQIVCHSISQVLENEHNIPCTIKRPNDILVQGKKICGILVESSSLSQDRVENVIIGIGLNVNEAPSGVVPKPISMKAVLGKDLDLDILLKSLLDALRKDLEPLYAHSS